MQTLSLHLSGRFEATLEGQAVTRFRSVKAQALLIFLALAENTHHSRDTLARFFWPDQAAAQAKQNLRQTLARLRKALDHGPQPILSVDRQSVKLNRAAVWLDVDVFRGHLAEVEEHQHAGLEGCPSCTAKLERAASLIKGDLVAGLALEELDGFEEWLTVERERFRQQAVDLLWRLGNLAEGRGQFDSAQDYARLQLELEPWREEAHLQLLRVLAKSGQRSRALAQFEACKRVLAEELGVEPSLPLLDLAERLKHPDTPALSHPPGADAEHNLPSQLTPFVGRQQEIAALTERLRQPRYRLLSLVGPGGVGKTRLALEVGVRQLDRFRGVYFVPLVSVQSVDDVPTAVLQSLGVSSSGSQLVPEEQLVSVLEGKAFLLILDNLEHVRGMPPFLTSLLEKLPELVLLVTSRARMDLQAEDVFFLEGLSVPDDASGRAANYSAVRLYLDRARRVQKDFRLEASNLGNVVRICRKVEGLPLAIELAASWTELLGTAHIADALDESLDVLRAELQDLAPHHRSVEAVFEQSWKLLSPEEQAVPARLSVFKGSFSVEAAQQVLGVGILELTRLRYKSLLRVSEAGRLDMHELLRQFAARKLSPEALLAVSEAHATFYLNLLASQHDGLAGLNPKAASAELQKDLDNIRQAWRWAVKHLRVEPLVKSATALSRFYFLTGLTTEGQHVFSTALDRLRQTSDAHRTLQTHLLLASANFAQHQNNYALAFDRLGEAITLAEATGDLHSELQGYCLKGEALYYKSASEEAHSLMQGIFPRIQRSGFRDLEAFCLRLLARSQPDLELEARLLKRALSVCRDQGNRALEQRVLINLGVVAGIRRDYANLERYLEEADKLSDYVADSANTSLLLNLYGYYFANVGYYHKALDVYHRSQKLCRERGDKFVESFVHHNYCLVYTLVGELALALEHGEEALLLARGSKAQDVISDASLHLAYAQLASGFFEQANEGFTRAYRGQAALGNKVGMIECKAGLAETFMRGGDLTQAVNTTETIMGFLKTNSLNGANEPIRIYLTCYEILWAARDKRARSFLEDAYSVLQSHAATIKDPEVKRSFFENVPFNQKLLSAWQSHLNVS